MKRKFDGDGEDAGSAKLVCQESERDSSSLEALGRGVTSLSTSPLRYDMPLMSPALSVDCIEHSEMKNEQISMQRKAKQSPTISQSHEKTTRKLSIIPEMDVPSHEQDENDNNLLSKSRKPLQAQESKETEDESSCSSSDSSSQSSEDDSLLSAWSDRTSQQGILPKLHVSSKYQGLERLEKKLEQRKLRLERLCEGQPPAYVYMLQQNEKLAATIKVAEYLKTNPDQSLSRKGKEGPALKAYEPSPLGILQFEWIHTMRCAYILLVQMAIHTTFYGVTDCSCRIFYEAVVEPRKVDVSSFYTFLMLVGFTLLRFNGGIFFYSSTAAYHRAKMEMSNRLRIGMLDARIFKRIKGNIIESYFNMFGYYLICIGISKFYYRAYDYVYAKADAWMNVIWLASSDLINADLKERQDEWEYFFETGQELSEEEDWKVSPSCAFAVDQVSKTFLKPFFMVLCRDTTLEYKSIELTFHTLCLLLIAYLNHRVGLNAMKACD